MSFFAMCCSCREEKNVRCCEDCGRNYCRDCGDVGMFSAKCPVCGGNLE